jgi:THO complex subunit 4
VELVYGPNSQSRGVANVTFHKSDGASKAFQKLNGLLVDNRPIKIEIVVGAAQADKVIPATKSLAERTSQPKGQPKAQPKSAAADKHNASAAKGATKGAAGNKKRRGRSSRPAKKTQEELDSEMADYFVAPAATEATSNPAAPIAAPAAAGGDADMDEIA